MDGANVEIVEKAGLSNEIIFGMTSEEVTHSYAYNHYKPREIYDQDQRLKNIFIFVRGLRNHPQYFDHILNALLNSDYYFVLKDFASYVDAHERANDAYKDRSKWLAMSIANIAHSGFFTSDRTITQYNKELWKLKKISF
jgi:starch phosphorylase